MMLVGLDLGPTVTGYCVGDGRIPPQVGAWRFPEFGEDYGRMGAFLSSRLTLLHRESLFDRLIIEAPILVTRRKADDGSTVFRPTDKLPKLRMLYGLGVVAETWAFTRGIAVSEVDARTVKKELTGDPWAKKPAMVAAAEADGIELPKTKADGREDGADAYACWRVGLRLYQPKVAVAWDVRSRQARGDLT